jgi:hypothetical protein
MLNITTKYRMYFLTMYNLSPIQKGIQAGHAALEYDLKYGGTQEYKDFTTNDKTWIVLNGGASGDMIKHSAMLSQLGVKYESFTEPDLNNSISAICYLLPEEDWYVKNGARYTENFDSVIYDYYEDDAQHEQEASELGMFTSKFKLAH